MTDDPRKETPTAVGMTVLARLGLIAGMVLAAVAIVVGVIVYASRT